MEEAMKLLLFVLFTNLFMFVAGYSFGLAQRSPWGFLVAWVICQSVRAMLIHRRSTDERRMEIQRMIKSAELDYLKAKNAARQKLKSQKEQSE